MPKGLKKRNAKTAGVFAAIRFLGAFRKSPVGFWEALKWEISGECPERAAMPLKAESQDFYNLAGVAVVFAASDVKRVFNADCWSELKDNGELFATRNIKGNLDKTGSGKHAECFVKSGAKAIAIAIDCAKISNADILNNISKFAADNNLQVIDCNKQSVKNLVNTRRLTMKQHYRLPVQPKAHRNQADDKREGSPVGSRKELGKHSPQAKSRSASADEESEQAGHHT